MVRIARREHCHPADDEGNTAIASGCNTDALGGTRVPASCRCIAEKCAMWRWHPRNVSHMGDDRKGYCGLAGTPGAAA